MNKLIISILATFIISCSLASALEIEKKDYLSLIVGNYVHGFKEFETSVTTFDKSVNIGIYYDVSTQDKERANKLAKRFRTQIPEKIRTYEWAKNIKIIINVYSEDLTSRGY